jgi:adenylate cyclase
VTPSAPRTETERKYLVRGRPWDEPPWRDQARSASLAQAYLNLDPERTVRIRLEDGQGYLTIKGRAHGDVRAEYEYPIPAADAGYLIEHLADGRPVEKIRHTLPIGGYRWQVDEYLGENAGLVVAEVERPADAPADLAWPPDPLPPFVGDDVTTLPGEATNRYVNSSLAVRPYATWPEEHRAVDGHLLPATRT